jgi:hypothetical protein
LGNDQRFAGEVGEGENFRGMRGSIQVKRQFTESGKFFSKML